MARANGRRLTILPRWVTGWIGASTAMNVAGICSRTKCTQELSRFYAPGCSFQPASWALFPGHPGHFSRLARSSPHPSREARSDQ